MLSVFVGYSGVFTVQFLYLETSMIFKECRQGGVGIHLVRLYKVVTTVCAETFITYFTVIVPRPGLSHHLNKHSDPRFHLLSHSPSPSLSMSGFSCTIMLFLTSGTALVSFPVFSLHVFNVCTVSLAVVLCYMQHIVFSNLLVVISGGLCLL